MTNLQQIKQIAAQLYLNLDNPESVRQQLKRIQNSQARLRELKQQVDAKLNELNQDNKPSNFGLDEAAAIGLHIFGQHRVARQVTRQGNRVERQERSKLKAARQPHIKMKDKIDNYLFEGDRLKQVAENYLKEHQGK